ncbi:MAG: hypothetical protein FJ184_12010 [Gammaproteobacteria bacterium]|nr:hypothetical protein [Gammaproteobacteria bacterium]
MTTAKLTSKNNIESEMIRINARSLYDALVVVAFTKETRNWLEENDPQALKQALSVLRIINPQTDEIISRC